MIILGVIVFGYVFLPQITNSLNYNQAQTESKLPIDFLIAQKDTHIDILITSHTSKVENITGIILSGDKLKYQIDNKTFSVKQGLTIKNYTLPFNLPDGSYTFLFNTSRLYTAYGQGIMQFVSLPKVSQEPPQTSTKYIIPVQYTQGLTVDTKPRDSSSSAWIFLPIIVVFIIVMMSTTRRNGK